MNSLHMKKFYTPLLSLMLFIGVVFAPKAAEARICTVRSPLDAGGVVDTSETLRFCIEDINAHCEASNLIRFNVTSMINNYGGDGVRNECTTQGCLRNPGGGSADIENGVSLEYLGASAGERVVAINIISQPLPAITCSNTKVDAENDYYRQVFGGQTTNSDCLGSGTSFCNPITKVSTAGTNQTQYFQIRRPMVEIANGIGPAANIPYKCPSAGTAGYETYTSDQNDASKCSYTWGLRVKANNVTIRGLAIYNFFVNIQTVSDTSPTGIVQGLTIEKNLIGTSARRLKDNTSNTPSQEKYSWRNGVGVDIGNAKNVTIKDNIFNWNFYGVGVGNPASDPWNSHVLHYSENISIERNEFLFNGPGRFATTGIATADPQENLFDYSPGQSIETADNIQFINTFIFTVKNNFIHDTVSSGPTSWYPTRVNYNGSGVPDPSGAEDEAQGKGIHIAYRNQVGDIFNNTIYKVTQAGIGIQGGVIAGGDLASAGVRIANNKIIGVEDAVGATYGKGQGIVISDTSATKAFGISIEKNSLANNAGLGIDLQDNEVTTNVDGDLDSGENGLMNFPTLLNQPISCSDLISQSTWFEFSGVTVGQGAVDGGTVEVFEATQETNDSAHGEGTTFVSSCKDNASCDLNNTLGVVKFLLTIQSGKLYTATTTSNIQDFYPFGTFATAPSTSEFSSNFTAVIPASCAPSPTPLPWFRLQDSSLLTSGNISNLVPTDATGYSDNNPDTTVVRGEAGPVVVGGSTNYGSGQVSTRKWEIAGYNQVDPSAALTQNKIQSLVDAILAKKTYKEITVGDGTDFSAITSDGIYYVSTGQNLIINDTNAGVFSGKRVVLVVKGSVFIVKSNGDFLPDNLVILATGGTPEQSTITIDRTITELRGIYISPIFDTGSSNLGLRVRGNVMATVLRLHRNNANNNKPGLMVEFDPAQFITALPYIGGNRYRWSDGQ